MRTKRQNIQLELALEPEAKGEARSAGGRGTEARTACAEPERPAAGRGPSMEAVVEPGNLRKALARVRRNKGAPGIDGMTVEELGAWLKDHWPAGFAIVVDLDLEKFFDRVNHDILMGLVAQRVADKRLLKLIRGFLTAGVLDGGLVGPTTEGVPQGSGLTPRTQKVTSGLSARLCDGATVP